MFVRKKNIKGRAYYYLVRSVRNGETIRQECLEYLGPKLPAKKVLEAVKRKHSR
jgi:hypothetical protein